MPIVDDLTSAVASIFSGIWDADRVGYTVPQPADLRLDSNHGINIDATVLYADMSDSTGLVDTKLGWFAAEIYKAYMHVAGKLVRANGGEITAYDGDRIMALFIGESQETRAVRCARQLHWALFQIIRPGIVRQYGENAYNPWHTVGIDKGRLLAVRIGVRGGNDIVWVGSAANHAAKMCAFSDANAIRISQGILDAVTPELKMHNGTFVWDIRLGSAPSGANLWSTSWWFRPGQESFGRLPEWSENRHLRKERGPVGPLRLSSGWRVQ